MELRKKSFTLMELLVVMVIIGLLAGLVGPKVMEALGGSKQTIALNQLTVFKDAVKMYKLDKNKFPTSLEELISGDKLYIEARQLPKDPWGNDYVIRQDSKMGYDIVSLGQDGADGGAGEDKDISCWDNVDTLKK